MAATSHPRMISVFLVFVALIVVAQFNVSSLLKGISSLDSSSNTDSLHLRITQLQSELQAVETSRNRLQVQMDSLTNISSSAAENTDPQVLASIAALQAQLKDMQESKDTLELLVKSWMNWNSDPYLGSNADPSLCKNSTKLDEYGCKQGKGKCPGLYDHPICLDHFPPPKECIVYDFGIRENPEFGQTLLNPPFFCKVFAFDPSPITETWYKESPRSAHLRKHPNYTLFHYGAGGKNGNVQLGEYDWGQVSIVRFPLEIFKNCTMNATLDKKNCQIDYYGSQRKKFQLPVRTLDSIMKELGHDHIDILKVDVEGSEYAFLEHALEHDTLDNVHQLTIEWHHYDFDSRYGGGSTPAINAIVALLQRIGFRQFSIHDDRGGWPGVTREYWEKGITLRYNLASFLRVDDKDDDNDKKKKKTK